MGKVGKIAIGCVLFLFLAGVALIAGLGGLAWWGKGKLESKLQEVQKDESRIDDAHKRADANTFVEPADGVIDEDRLVKFLEVRKRVFGVYEQHKAEFEALKDKKQGDPTPIPPSHYTDYRNAPDRVGDQVVGARYVCVSCHAAKTDAPNLVGNRFRP